MSRDASFAEIADALGAAKTVLVASHLRPDGDALGSTIAFSLWLKSLGKEVTAWNENGISGKFHYLPEWRMVGMPEGEGRRFDAVVALDNSVKARLGTVLNAIEVPGVFINMDHHVSNERYGSLNHVDSVSPATGQIVFEFLESVGATITPEIAGNLYAAISTDTGSFQYPNTTARTFEVAAALVRAGVDVGGLSRAIYATQPRRRIELLRHLLNVAKFSCDDRIASCTLTQTDVTRMGTIADDNEGMIDVLRSVDTVIAAAFFEEMADGKIRVSARSKDVRVDVCKVCAQFGGGGHALAAGARIGGGIAEVEKQFLEALCSEIGRVD